MFGREQLGDPLGERGKAVAIPPIKIPSFDNVIKMRGDNNALMLRAAKYHREQQQKEAALQLQRDKMAQAAAQKAEAEKARKQAAMYSILTPETDPLMGDMPKRAAEAYGALLKEAQGLYDRGIDINSFDPEAVAFRSGPLLNYHTNYKRHAEVAKTFMAKQKTWSEKSDDFEPYSLTNELVDYNKTDWGAEYYPSSLIKRVGVATPAEIAAYEKTMLGEAVSRNSQGKKPIRYNADGDAIYQETESYGARPFEMTVEDVNKNLKHSTDPKQREIYNFYYNQAKAQGLVDEGTGEILPQYFQKREEVTRDKGGVKDVIVQIQKDKSDSDNTSKFIRQFYRNSLIMGTKTTPVAAMPAQSDINAGKVESGTEYFLQPAAEITVTRMNNLPGNTLGANSAWKIDREGKVTPVESNEDVGSIPTDRIVYLPTNEQGQPYMSYQNSKTGANKNLSARFANSGRNYQAFSYKTDKEGNVIVVNLHKSFNGTLSERGIATELTPQEIDRINGRDKAQQLQTPVQENAPAGMKPKDKKAKKQF